MMTMLLPVKLTWSPLYSIHTYGRLGSDATKFIKSLSSDGNGHGNAGTGNGNVVVDLPGA